MINTQEYLSQVLPTYSVSVSQNSNLSILEKGADFIHHHPRLVQITRIALVALSACVMGLAFSLSSILLGAVGITCLILTKVVHQKLAQYGIIASPMTYHAYQAGKCEGGELFYQGDIPVLKLNSDDPFIAGKAHGYLTAAQLLNLSARIGKMSQLPKASECSDTLEKILHQLPKNYLQEMEGMVEGVNNWIDQQYWFNRHPKISLNDILLANLMPDSLYFNPRNQQVDQPHAWQNSQVGCTVAVVKDPKEGPIFGRNMDWPSFGLAGTYTLAINRQYRNGKSSSVEIGMPGMVGALTGMNSAGLSIAMNVCGAQVCRTDGIPAAFYNRMVLENCKTVADTSRFVDRNKPFGSYHLTVADNHNAQSYHFYQGNWNNHVVRKLTNDQPLTVSNFTYRSSNNPELDMHHSTEREEILHHFFEDAQRKIKREELDLNALVAHSLTLPYVNNVITTHSVEMVPGQKRIWAAFDNAYSASQKLQEIDTTNLL